MSILIAAATALECELVRARARAIITGVGQVNMAHALTLAIEQQRPDAIVVVGIGGAYPGSTLTIGDVVCATSETFGDLGVEAPEGFVELTEFVQNTYPLQIFPASRRARFVTVSTCTGTDELTRRVQVRTRGEVENMEGAAAVQIAARYGIPIGEIRGISNLTGRRERSSWKIPEAARSAQEALLSWLASQPISFV